ncbi:MAG: hypothetical protein ACI38B_07665 [Bifidobacterium sp.]|uniref:hypothetical protein n=1 Tax=Bifidobacterium sp. TaxID=41200 RepID=UPI003F0E6E35
MTNKEEDASQRAYWESLMRSFGKRFPDKVRREYDPRKRPDGLTWKVVESGTGPS